MEHPTAPVTCPCRFEEGHCVYCGAEAAAALRQPVDAIDAEGVEHLIELRMKAFADEQPARDDEMGEQTILTYSEKVGTWGLEFFESGWEFPDKWLGGTHWLDISTMWPGVTAQVTEFRTPSPEKAEIERLEEQAEEWALVPVAKADCLKCGSNPHAIELCDDCERKFLAALSATDQGEGA